MSDVTTKVATYTKVGTDVRIAPVLKANIVSFAAGAATATIDLKDYDFPEDVMLEVSFTPGSGGTLDVVPSISTEVGGTYYTLLDSDGSTAGAVPQMTTAALVTREFKVLPGYRFVKVSWDVGTADSYVAINLICYKPRYATT